MTTSGLTDAERFPLATEEGRRLLRRLKEDPHAPRFNYEAGERLSASGLERVQAFAADLEAGPRGWRSGAVPPWLPGFVERCLDDVPFFRRYGGTVSDFAAVPTMSRADLAREPWAFVPDSAPLDDLIVYPTSGTTGHPLRVLAHPEVPAKYVPLLRRALAAHGTALEGGPGRVAVVLVGFQRRTYTFVSLSTFLGEAGFVKLNLHPDDWRDPGDRVQFLDSCDPEVYSGDPLSFLELTRLHLRSRPKALISTAMALLPGYREQLARHFACPVLDLYSLNESGPVAVFTGRGHELLPHDLYVEVLGPDDEPCPPGIRGEVTLTGGRNPFLPLLRYRTGDWASLDLSGRVPILVGLEGRPPTVFRAVSGQLVNNIDVTWALQHLALPQFALHQEADGELTFRVRGPHVSHESIRAALVDLFGAGQKLSIRALEDAEASSGKVVQYTSALGG